MIVICHTKQQAADTLWSAAVRFFLLHQVRINAVPAAFTILQNEYTDCHWIPDNAQDEQTPINYLKKAGIWNRVDKRNKRIAAINVKFYRF